MAYLLQLLLAFCLVNSAWTSSQTKDSSAPATSVPDSSKVLIVYLSRTNNTKALAEIIHRNVGGSLVARELSTPK